MRHSQAARFDRLSEGGARFLRPGSAAFFLYLKQAIDPAWGWEIQEDLDESGCGKRRVENAKA